MSDNPPRVKKLPSKVREKLQVMEAMQYNGPEDFPAIAEWLELAPSITHERFVEMPLGVMRPGTWITKSYEGIKIHTPEAFEGMFEAQP